jgi:protein associated with RNAse G/E
MSRAISKEEFYIIMYDIFFRAFPRSDYTFEDIQDIQKGIRDYVDSEEYAPTLEIILKDPPENLTQYKNEAVEIARKNAIEKGFYE